jgi:glycosyltransferase involved in cell wall biosynthesis
MREPVVSVVIPCRDRAPALAAAIGSVLAQDAPDLEVIVADDGSSVPLKLQLEAVPEAADGRVRFLRSASARGAAAARNAGIDAARGRFVALLDSDDLWLPGKLSAQIAFMEGLPDPDRSASFTGVLVRRDGRDVEVRPRVAPRRGEPLADFLWLRGGFIQTSAVIVGRRAAAATPFCDGMTRHQDFRWYLDLEAAGCRFEFLPRVLSVWNDDRRGDRLTLGASADGALAWAAAVPEDRWSPRTRAAFEFGAGFVRLVETGACVRAMALAARTLPLLGPFWVAGWLARGIGARLRSRRPRAEPSRLVEPIWF